MAYFHFFLIAYIHRVCLEHIDLPVDFSAFICPIVLSTTLIDFSMRVSKNYIWTEEFSGFWLVASENTLLACMHARSLSCVWLFLTPWTVAGQAPLSMGFSRHEYWSGLPFHPLGDLPDPGIRPASPVSLALASGFFAAEPPGKPKHIAWIPLNAFDHLLASRPLWKQPETLSFFWISAIL